MDGTAVLHDYSELHTAFADFPQSTSNLKQVVLACLAFHHGTSQM